MLPGGVVMPCFEPVLTMTPGVPSAIIAGANDLHAVEDAAQIDVQDAPPPRPGSRHGPPPSTDAGVVHQHGDFAERFDDMVA